MATLESRIDECSRTRSTLLDLSHLGISEVPNRIRGLAQLKILHLHSNDLRGLPDWLRELGALEELSLDDNPLGNVPPVCRELTELRLLTLDGVGLRNLPGWISELTHLGILSVSRNELSTIPDSLGRFSSLNVLRLDNNRLSDLPLSLQNVKITALFLHGNLSLGIPAEILGPRWDEKLPPADPKNILEYYIRTRQNQGRALNEAKLVLVGRGEVGKTSLVERLLFDRFSTQKKTEGIQITRWPIADEVGESIEVHIWDFGGQEIMHATHQFFLTERSLYLLVLNGREGGEDADVEYWLKLIESFGGDSPVIVVLNKIHSHPFDLNRRGLLEKYPGRIRDFVRTDCEDTTGLAELKTVILREMVNLPHLRSRFPIAWFAIKDALSSMKENYLSFEGYRELCTLLGEADEKAQDILAYALHCLGIALNFRDDPRLREHHVLNPHWVTKGIYTILNSESIAKSQGELERKDLAAILDVQDYPVSVHGFMLGLMRKFELCFRFPDPRDDTYLIPQLLGKEQPALGEEFQRKVCLNFQYTYPIWPEGLIPRFIVRTHALSTGQQRWRTGVVLEFEGNRALVKGDQEEKTVFVSITGPLEGRRRLLAVIRSDFERIHADIRGLKPVASIPLPDNPSSLIPYDVLRTFEQQGIEYFPYAIGNKVITVGVEDLMRSVELPSASIGPACKVFISYSHKDDDLRAELETHLKLFQRVGLVDSWHDRRLSPGENWRSEIDRNLEGAQLILLLISADFLASDYCYDVEMQRAVQRHIMGDARMLPIIVRDCVWQDAPFADIQALPRDGKPVRLWEDRDSAWKDVVQGIRKAIAQLRARPPIETKLGGQIGVKPII